MFKSILVTAALIASPTAVATDVSIEDVAPESSFLVVGFDNARTSIEHFKSTPIWNMLHDDEMDGDFKDAMARFESMIESVEMEAGLDEGALQWPDGPAGFAMFMTMNNDWGIETSGLMAYLDYQGETATLQKLIETALDHADRNDVAFGEIDLNGRTVYAFVIPEPDDDAQNDGFAEGDAGLLADPLGMLKPMMLGVERLYLTRVDDALLCSTNLAVLQTSIEAAEGEDVPSIADVDAYKASLAQVGRQDGHCALLLQSFADFAQMQPLIMLFGPMLSEPLRALGLNDVDAIGMSIDLDAPEAAIVQHVGVLVDGEKRGLVQLFDGESPLSDVPALVTDDAVSISRVNLRFSGVMDVVNDLLKTIPLEFRQEAEGMMLEYGQDVATLLSGLGDEVYTINHGDGRAKTVAIKSANSQDVESALSRLAGPLGLQPRDFAGMQIYSASEFAFVPMSVAIGGGYVFIGEPQRVEDALRSGVTPPLARLGDAPGFRAAASLLGSRPVVAWGYTDTGAMLKSMRDAFATQVAAMSMQMDINAQDFDLDEVAPDPEFITRYIGPSAWAVRSVDNGFILTSYTLHAVDE